MKRVSCFVAILVASGGLIVSSRATPQLAREYKMECASCHAHVPKLNAFGEQFLADGYRLPGEKKARTIPIAVWFSGLSQNMANDADRFKTVPNRIELISSGASDDGRFSYFAEWRMLSKEFLSDGSVRDRSGRFEDFYANFSVGSDVQLQVGQFRALSQIDVSRRLNLAEPTVFSTSMAGETDPDPRIQSLRGFSPAGRAPSVQARIQRNGWTGVATVPFPGEFSIPLTNEARHTASFEFEDTPKGVFLEAFRREGVNSFGVHGFLGRNDRQLFGLAGQQKCNDLWFEGGIARAEVGGNREWRHSIGVDWIPCQEFAAGVRFDQRQIAGQKALFLPYVSLLRPFGEQAAKLVVEGRLQDGRTPRWVIELGWMF